MVIMTDFVAIDVESPGQDYVYSLVKDFTKLIYMNASMVLNLNKHKL